MENAVSVEVTFSTGNNFGNVFCFPTKTMHCYTYRCRNVFTIEVSTTWVRDSAHERTGAWSINARKLLNSSRVHIKTKSK